MSELLAFLCVIFPWSQAIGDDRGVRCVNPWSNRMIVVIAPDRSLRKRKVRRR